MYRKPYAFYLDRGQHFFNEELKEFFRSERIAVDCGHMREALKIIKEHMGLCCYRAHSREIIQTPKTSLRPSLPLPPELTLGTVKLNRDYDSPHRGFFLGVFMEFCFGVTFPHADLN